MCVCVLVCVRESKCECVFVCMCVGCVCVYLFHHEWSRTYGIPLPAVAAQLFSWPSADGGLWMPCAWRGVARPPAMLILCGTFARPAL